MWKVKSRYVETFDNGMYKQGNIEKVIYYNNEHVITVETLAKNPFVKKDDELGIATVVDRGEVIFISANEKINKILEKDGKEVPTIGRITYFVKSPTEIYLMGWQINALESKVRIAKIDLEREKVEKIYKSEELVYEAFLPFAYDLQNNVYLAGEIYPIGSPSDICAQKKVKENTLKLAKIENNEIKVIKKLENKEDDTYDIVREVNKKLNTNFKTFVY